MNITKIELINFFDLNPTTIDDARDAIERLGHSFYVFLNANTGNICTSEIFE